MPKRPLHMLYIIGQPGVGKTTLLRKLLRSLKLEGEQKQVPYVYITWYSSEVIQLGWDREQFGGTDSLGMAAQPHVLKFLEQTKPSAVLAEGDRLANKKFFDAVRAIGYDLTVVLFEVPPKQLKEQRERRNRKLGKEQNERWLATRATKVANLAGEVDPDWRLDPTATKETAKRILAHPVGRALRRAARG